MKEIENKILQEVKENYDAILKKYEKFNNEIAYYSKVTKSIIVLIFEGETLSEIEWGELMGKELITHKFAVK